MLKVENFGYKYGKSKFEIKDVNFSLEDGYLMCLVGKNGAGKTTLLKGIYGLLEPESGAVTYNNVCVVEGKRNCQIANHTQNNHINGSMESRNDEKGSQVEGDRGISAGQTNGSNARGEANGRKTDRLEKSGNLCAYHREAAFVGNVTWFFEDFSMEENANALKSLYTSFDEKEYARLLQLFGLQVQESKKKYVELSTGEKMLFQLAFVMARHPRLLLLDEPFANLDPIVKVDLAQLFQEKIQQENVQIILSTHLVDDISDMVDYIGVVKDGQMVKFGDREAIFEGSGVDGLREYILKDSVGGGVK